MGAKTSETLKEMRRLVREELIAKKQLQPAQATELAIFMVEVIRSNYAGGQLYMAMDAAGRLEKRDWEMWEIFTGDNYEDIARRFEPLTPRQVRNRINIVRRIVQGREQGSLFDEAVGE